MYKKISRIITNKLIQLDIINSGDYDIYKYGFELLISLLFTTIFILIFSAIINKFIETLLFMIVFLVTRIICGGYHAKHHYSCFLGTISIYVFSLLLYYLIYSTPFAYLIMFPATIVSALIIIIFSPIEHPNNPMTAYRKVKNRFLSRILSIFICLMCFVSLFIEHKTTSTLSFYIGFIFAAITVLVAKIEIIILKRKEEA